MQTAASLPALRLPPPIACLGRGRITLAVAALGVIAAGAAWQWSSLVAIGVAPLLLSLAPCAAMCGLGLCMRRTRDCWCDAVPQAAASSETRET